MRTLIFIILLGCAAPGVALGKTENRQTLCLDAAARAEATHKIPRKLLQAITLVETGRTSDEQFVAWPWTTNVNAQGSYFETKKDALNFVKSQMDAGETSIDIGCFQINTKWHGDAFDSIADMADPDKAADYAAKFLVTLKDEFGDWNTAASRYHSRTPAYAQRYAQKLSSVRKSLDGDISPALIETPLLAQAIPANESDVNLGGVALSMFLDVQPLFDRQTRRSILSDAPSP